MRWLAGRASALRDPGRRPVGQGALTPVGAEAERGLSPLVAKRGQELQAGVVLIIAIGLDEDTFRQAIKQATPDDPGAPLPLFLTDQVDFRPLTEHDHLFEHFPSATSKAIIGDDLPWEHYAERRLDLLVSKWRPVSIVPLGKASHRILSNWRQRNAERSSN